MIYTQKQIYTNSHAYTYAHTAITDVGGKCLDAASIATSTATSTAPGGRQGTIRRQQLRVDRRGVASGRDSECDRIPRHRFRRVQRGYQRDNRRLDAHVSE